MSNARGMPGGGGGMLKLRFDRYISLENERDNFCVVLTYSMKRAREIRKFHVSGATTAKKCSK